MGLAALIATHNPAELIIGTGVKLHGEKTGSSTVEGKGQGRLPRKSPMCSKNDFRTGRYKETKFCRVGKGVGVEGELEIEHICSHYASSLLYCTFRADKVRITAM